MSQSRPFAQKVTLLESIRQLRPKSILCPNTWRRWQWTPAPMTSPMTNYSKCDVMHLTDNSNRHVTLLSLDRYPLCCYISRAAKCGQLSNQTVLIVDSRSLNMCSFRLTQTMSRFRIVSSKKLWAVVHVSTSLGHRS